MRWRGPAWDLVCGAVERRLEAERDQLALWIPVALGGGVAAYFILPDARGWAAFLLAALGIALAGFAAGQGGRAARVVAVAGLLLAIGLSLAWWRADRVAAPVLPRPVVAAFTARIAAIEPQPARALARLTLDPFGPGETMRGRIALPPRVRVNLAEPDMPAGLRAGAVIRLRARLMPPPSPAVPGAYDFARVAWFAGIGATGRGFAPVERVRTDPSSAATPQTHLDPLAQPAQCARAGGGPGFQAPPTDAALNPVSPPARRHGGCGATLATHANGSTGADSNSPGSPTGSDCANGCNPERIKGADLSASASLANARTALATHITGALPGSAGGIAAALVTGDMGAIGAADAEAMRRAGLAHLLSVSGLHITAVVGATMLIVLRLLALSPWMALHLRLPLIAAGAGAGAAISYTFLTGSQVPTIRSCVAALLVLVAMALGRRAMTLRLVAAGALVVLILWPEALTGPSFQLSFAAITAIVALHEHPVVAGWFAPREERWPPHTARALASLLLTGLVVEAALMPIAVYHFHKAGLYGAAANIVAIPLTTFVVMPLVAAALAFDVAGIGAPLWWLAGQSIELLLRLAHFVARAPGAVASLPAMPGAAFALIVAGGLWLALWRTRLRLAGLAPLALGTLWALATPPPDIVVTGDGRHLAVRTPAGLALLRDRAGDYTRATLAENAGAGDTGTDGTPLFLADQPDARCSRDLCLTDLVRGTRRWRLVATRSAYLVPAARLIPLCRTADIVVSDRRLPAACVPRWLRLDRAMLARTGGVAITLASGRIASVNRAGDRHPWRVVAQSYRRRIPDSLP